MYDETNRTGYVDRADRILENLTNRYRASVGKDCGFLLLHSTGSKTHGSEVDVPIVYADYYYLEALLRKAKLEKEQSKVSRELAATEKIRKKTSEDLLSCKIN